MHLACDAKGLERAGVVIQGSRASLCERGVAVLERIEGLSDSLRAAVRMVLLHVYRL